MTLACNARRTGNLGLRVAISVKAGHHGEAVSLRHMAPSSWRNARSNAALGIAVLMKSLNCGIATEIWIAGNGGRRRRRLGVATTTKRLRKSVDRRSFRKVFILAPTSLCRNAQTRGFWDLPVATTALAMTIHLSAAAGLRRVGRTRSSRARSNAPSAIAQQEVITLSPSCGIAPETSSIGSGGQRRRRCFAARSTTRRLPSVPATLTTATPGGLWQNVLLIFTPSAPKIGTPETLVVISVGGMAPPRARAGPPSTIPSPWSPARTSAASAQSWWTVIIPNQHCGPVLNISTNGCTGRRRRKFGAAPGRQGQGRSVETMRRHIPRSHATQRRPVASHASFPSYGKAKRTTRASSSRTSLEVNRGASALMALGLNVTADRRLERTTSLTSIM
mmetsp:Transcript_48933/g.114262  ORF Transcript_48933/g.114262 Transcript_48933/m.114262 type:complete len:391 (-) Transcript_48933:1349-2521(-)